MLKLMPEIVPVQIVEAIASPLGGDGKLYFAGESAGGNSIYRYDPKYLSVAAPNVKFDPYNHAYNTA